VEVENKISKPLFPRKKIEKNIFTSHAFFFPLSFHSHVLSIKVIQLSSLQKKLSFVFVFGFIFFCTTSREMGKEKNDITKLNRRKLFICRLEKDT
jgi:hypothetical protein